METSATVDLTPIQSAFLAAFGLVLLIATWWSRRGRSRAARWWVRDSWGREFVLGMMPGLGASTLVLGVLGIFVIDIDAIPDLAAGVLGLIFIVSTLALVLGFFNLLPRFLEPSWYRDALEGREDGLPSDALGAVSSGVVGGHDVSSADALSHFLPAGSSRRPTYSWGANWVRDPDTLERDHGTAPRGAVPGRLELRTDSVGFAALATEDRIRGEAIAWAIAFTDLTTARLVPPRAGIDGIPRPGILHRSLWRRLVLETDDQAYLVDLRRPKKVLAQIEQLRRQASA